MRDRSVPSLRRAALDGFRTLADCARQLTEDPLDLLSLGAGDLRLPVVQLDRLERLDEERLT